MVKFPECGSNKIIPDVPLLEHVGEAGIAQQVVIKVAGSPEAWIFKDKVKGTVSLSICGECGHAELHVSNARELWQKYKQAQQGSGPG